MLHLDLLHLTHLPSWMCDMWQNRKPRVGIKSVGKSTWFIKNKLHAFLCQIYLGLLLWQRTNQTFITLFIISFSISIINYQTQWFTDCCLSLWWYVIRNSLFRSHHHSISPSNFEKNLKQWSNKIIQTILQIKQ